MTPLTSDQGLAARGAPGWLCYPCKTTLEKTKDFGSIGTSAWINNGYDIPDSHEPIMYCCCCRYILRARELAKRRGHYTEQGPYEVPVSFHYSLDESALLLHDEDTNLEDTEGVLETFDIKADSQIRTVRRHWADLEMIKGWLLDCENKHGVECSSHREPEIDSAPLLLLDVHGDCLVTGSFNDRYFALSYVWGASKQYLTLAENYNELCKPGSVSAQPLTQTIKDAISFVRDIGERYLWIDTMCIIQDDYQNKAAAIAQMCAIYSRAVATIVAASGNSADAGLPGIPPTPRNQIAAPVAPGLQVVYHMALRHMMTGVDYSETESVYSTRAWTFQERLLSSRTIIITNEQVYFQCKDSLRSEAKRIPDTRASELFTLDKMRNAKKDPFYSRDAFEWYAKIASEYTTKRMGYPSDILNAFRGVQTDLQNTFFWAFHAGLPILKLDQALLWTPTGDLRRRTAETSFPSWCWSGWVGGIGYSDMLHPEDNNIPEDTFIPTKKKPTTGNVTGLATMISWDLFQPLGTRTLEEPYTVLLTSATTKLNAFNTHKTPEGLADPGTMNIFSRNSYYISNQQNQRCGLLIGAPVDCDLTTNTADLLLVRLSRWKTFHNRRTHGPRIGFFRDDTSMWDENLFDPAFRDDEWCTSNVMLVRPVETWWERVAVGVVHGDAWESAQPEWSVVAVK
ncbi:heterokaryon incompatibility protein-domain-containing protein [Boeremia exigua]|uniref:heterokaryon incompatibility protein-domain-containing protein n=1 Tax=Boeremia exigua TaxID=749465 RepID=UPI001E8CB8D4|nr:heterokaryon incompatibility protein-domain-containing protein [Boeremia exigua]KAH6612115.1 heterokaryon incompatibility protein-domain-containing protein [Boeremia exigua]